MFTNLISAIEAFNQKLKDLPDGPTPESPNSEKLEGNNFTTLQEDVDLVINSHIQGTGNTHGLTASSLSANTREETDDVIKSLVPIGMLPIHKTVDLTNEIVISGFTFSIIDSVVIFYMQIMQIPEDTVDLTSLFPGDYENKTFHLYIHCTDLVTGGTLVVSEVDNLATDGTYLYLGSITTDTTNIATVDLPGSFIIAGKKLSNVVSPNSIPVSDGFPMDSSTHW